MNFSIFLIGIVLLVALLVVSCRFISALFAPHFVCKLPDQLKIASLSLDPKSSNSFCVYCGSDRSLGSIFRFFPWESRGVISFDGNEIHYEGSRHSHGILERLGLKRKKNSHIRYRFPRQKVKISYMPPRFWRDGGLTWMKMEAHQENFYFTTGKSRLGIVDNDDGELTTTGIYKLVSEI
ncbi:MAG TPA: hypothetical protein PKA63_04525 [Oligoflexia bacterium]|nr:hypothetical protein [Oligoflexia bacterium]HMP47915.1 hypothetical protein [Oligoflexia bacterium]